MKEQPIGTNMDQIPRHAQNRYLNQLVGPSFQGVNRLFVLSFENEDDGTSHSEYLPIVEVVKTFLINQ